LSVVFVKEEDIATYTIKAADDPRTLNKILYMRPPANVLSFNEIVSLWERKIGTTLEKTYLLEDELLQKIQGWSIRRNSINRKHIKRYQLSFSFDGFLVNAQYLLSSFPEF